MKRSHPTAGKQSTNFVKFAIFSHLNAIVSTFSVILDPIFQSCHQTSKLATVLSSLTHSLIPRVPKTLNRTREATYWVGSTRFQSVCFPILACQAFCFCHQLPYQFLIEFQIQVGCKYFKVKVALKFSRENGGKKILLVI